jgi:acyl-CoA synthetase (AMP-forming)/AMP-acid ligase II
MCLTVIPISSTVDRGWGLVKAYEPYHPGKWCVVLTALRSATAPSERPFVSIIHTSPLPDVEIPETPISGFVLRQAAIRPDAVAITDGAESFYTYAELSDAIHRMAGGLAARGFGPGSTLGLMAPNIPEYAIVFHAAAVAGGTVTTINPTYGAEEVRFQLQDAGASLLITVPMFVDVATAGMEGTDVTNLYVMGDVDGVAPMSDLFGEPIEQVAVDVHDDVVVLPYSSGTTGLPKGVMLTHYNLVANICQMEHVLDYEGEEVALAALPFFHIYGMQVLMNGLLANGVRVVTMPRFDMGDALGLVQSQKVTRFFAVPPMVLGLAKVPDVDNFDLSSVKQIFSGAAPLGAELANEAAARVGCEVVQGYGMTELSPVTHSTVEGQGRPGTSGVPISNVECRIVDPESGEDQPAGERGELWVRGPMVMKGYLNNEEATAATIDADGWLHTGDVALIDEAGHYSIVDRIKELIKYNGFQVPPAELEGLLITHPAVVDVAVVGVPDVSVGELPKAFVTLAPGASLTLDEVQAFVSEHFVSYKQIRLLEEIDVIPKSASGKILRRELRDRDN